MRLIFLDFPIFLDLNREYSVQDGRSSLLILRKSPNWQAGMAFAKIRRNEPLFSARLGILFDAANQKGSFSQEGAASLSSQERKAENEECL